MKTTLVSAFLLAVIIPAKAQMVLPPEEFDHPYNAKLPDGSDARLMVARVKSNEEVQAFCKPSNPPHVACSYKTAFGCLIVMATDEVIKKSPGPNGIIYPPEVAMRHELGHCNGWSNDHAGSRDFRLFVKSLLPEPVDSPVRPGETAKQRSAEGLDFLMPRPSQPWPEPQKTEQSPQEPQNSEQPLLHSLPAKVQKQIEEVRASCREHLDGLAEDPESGAYAKATVVSSGDEGLETFTVSGLRAVMVNDVELCGGECLRGTNCTNRNSYGLVIYVQQRGGHWTRELKAEAVGRVFLSVKDEKFNALVLSVFSGNRDCPTHDVHVREGKESYVLPAWKQSCDAIVRWNGTKFTYKPL